MADLIDLPSWKLSTADLIQQLAMLNWIDNGEEGKEFFKLVTNARVGMEIFNRLSNQDKVDQCQAECILAIAQYVKTNPKASEAQLAAEIAKHIETFKTRIESL